MSQGTFFFTYCAKIDLILSGFFFRVKIRHEASEKKGAKIWKGVGKVLMFS